ncbi:MAG: hypothetical protein ACTSWD_02450 [Candidatus Heimdallarchaeota archaeon]
MKRTLDDKMIVDVEMAVGGYNYYGYVSPGADSQYIIMRENIAETEYRYAYGSDFDTDWNAGDPSGLTFIRPSELNGRG